MEKLNLSIKSVVRKTGTTIVGIKFKDGVALFADTRSTMGEITENKNCFKLHRITNTIYCAGAGTAADTEKVTRMTEKSLQLYERKYFKEGNVLIASRIIINHLHRYQGYIGAALILAGKNNHEFNLIEIHPHGSSNECFFASLGSGSLAATGILENEYKKELTEEEAVNLGIKAVKAGIMNDLFSGSNVDYLVIKNDGSEMFRTAVTVCKREPFEPIKMDRKIEIVEEIILNVE